MRLVPILSVIGFLLLAVGIAMLTALPFSYYYGEADFQPILYSALITMTVGILLMVFMRKMESDDLRVREGFAIVTFGWLVVALFGSLPFLLSGTISSFTDAFFETMSGFTTTGASILTEVEKMPHGLLYWRALSHWLGGMGIIVLSLAVLPLLGIGGMQLFRAEVSGPTKDKLTPRITETARLLWGVYVLLTAVETGLLMYGGMSFFDALCHAFATISTGGFSTKNASLATYDSAYFDWVITIFMFIGGTNFALHYSALRGKMGSYLKDNEFVFFFVSTVVAIILVTASIQYSLYDGDVLRAVRYAAFNVV
ncbi:MAG TPA: potassium transporter TrkG, partial [Bacteroidota bacterium]